MEICVIEGDDIGHEVVPAALQVLQAVLPNLQAHQRRAGWDYFNETGRSLDDETIALARQTKAVLYGAVSSPSYPVEGYFSPIVRLRRQLDTYANIRPTRYLPIPTARAGLDLLVVRENTEDVYVVEEELAEDGQSSFAKKVVTRGATERIAHTAYALARQNGRQRVTIVHKANVLPQTDGLFRRVALEVSEHHPGIQTDDMLVDTAAYWLVKDPTRFDVILTSNQYGDILSDMAAAWGGGLGISPALNMGDGVAIAEPVHGSAPDIAGQGRANPIAMMRSAALLVRYHWGLDDAAQRIDDAIYAVLEDKLYTADIQAANAVSTHTFTEAVLRKLG
jgi:homoisocitrate dehydrogenase